MKKILLSPWTALLTLIFIVSVRVADPSFVESVRLRYFDTLITAKPATENPIYTINIDEASLDKYGQWPFKRDVYANIIQNLYEHSAGLVVFNVLMPEQDRQGGDDVFADAIKTYPTILPNIPSDISKNTPKISGSAVLGPEYLDRIIQYPGIIANIPIIEEAATGTGTVNTLPEIDGVNRRIPLIVSVSDKLFPALSLETVALATTGDTTFQVKLNEYGVEKMRIPKFGPIATDTLGRIWIDWSQTSKSISLSNIPHDLEGSVVVVGPTAAGIGNPIPTSKGAVFPHEVQAAVIGTIMNNVVIQRPDYADGVEVLVLLITGTILLFLTRWIYIGLASIIALSVGAVFASHYVFLTYLYLFDITAFVCGILLVGLHAYGVKFLSEFFQKQQIKKQFGTYLSPALVEKLQKNPELLTLGGESKELTIYFSDIRAFSTLSEHYKTDPIGLTNLITRYMDKMLPIIMSNEGTVGKLIGDAIMAWWGAPLDVTNQALKALKSAKEMEIALTELNIELISEGKPPLQVGAGISTGTVFVGNMGSSDRFSYDILGDEVNLAARLEGQTKSYGVSLILSKNTLDKMNSENDK
jgi:adenylate cyclase